MQKVSDQAKSQMSVGQFWITKQKSDRCKNGVSNHLQVHLLME